MCTPGFFSFICLLCSLSGSIIEIGDISNGLSPGNILDIIKDDNVLLPDVFSIPVFVQFKKSTHPGEADESQKIFECCALKPDMHAQDFLYYGYSWFDFTEGKQNTYGYPLTGFNKKPIDRSYLCTAKCNYLHKDHFLFLFQKCIIQRFGSGDVFYIVNQFNPLRRKAITFKQVMPVRIYPVQTMKPNYSA